MDEKKLGIPRFYVRGEQEANLPFKMKLLLLQHAALRLKHCWRVIIFYYHGTTFYTTQMSVEIIYCIIIATVLKL